MGVREAIFAAVTGDPTLNSIGLNISNVYAVGAPKSPKEDFFAVLNWGTETGGVSGQRGAGKTTERDVALWVYDRQDTYDKINVALKQFCVVMDGITALPTGVGFIIQADWTGDSADAYDDAYERLTRWSSYTIVASGN